jgi:hypothetical protein
MNDNMVFLMQCSALLAERWQMVTPDMPLSWNPRDEKSVFGAVQKWLSHIDDTMFPIYNVWEIDYETALDLLERIPVVVFGFESYNTEYKDFEKDAVKRLFFQFLMIFEGAYASDKLKLQVYDELKESGFSTLAPLPKLYEWLEAELTTTDPHPLFPEGNAHWQGCTRVMRYFCNDTGYDLLDMTIEELYSGYELPAWCEEEVGGFVDSWAEAKVVNEQIDVFLAWANENEQNATRVMEVLRVGCAAVVASGWESDHFDLSKLEAVWQASQNGVQDNGTTKKAKKARRKN